MKKQFIGRKNYLESFENRIGLSEGGSIRFSGQPGIGKTTLLKKLTEICDAEDRPYIWLSMDSSGLSTGSKILFEMARSANHFPEAHKIAAEQHNKLQQNWEHHEETINTVMGALEKIDPTGGIGIGILHSGIDLAQGVFKQKADKLEKEVLKNSELFLLNILAKAGQKHPVCFLDTYEHVYKNNQKINSRIDFNGNKAREFNSSEVAIAVWMRQLSEFLVSNGWLVVSAGREFVDNKPVESMLRFSKEEILEAIDANESLQDYLPEHQDSMFDVLSHLSFEGNPLWLMVGMNLLERQLMQGDTLEQLKTDKRYLQTCFEEKAYDDLGDIEGIEYGACKLNMLNLLMRNTQGIEDSWMIALPRILDAGIIGVLFEKEEAHEIIKTYQLAGAFSEKGKQFRLHEEIQDLLLAYARQRGYLDQNETKEIHAKVFEYLIESHEFEPHIRNGITIEEKKQLEKLFPDSENPWLIEASFHRIMMNDADDLHDVDPKVFWHALNGSVSLSFIEKLQVAIASLSKFQVDQLLNVWKDEIKQWERFFGEDSAKALIEEKKRNPSLDLYSIEFWKERVQQEGTSGDLIGLGDAFSHHGQDQEAIVTYEKLLDLYGDSESVVIQDQCAKALYNKGVTQGQLGETELAIQSYDELLGCYGDSEHVTLQDQCAKALYNKGFRQGQLGESELEIQSYDELLGRYGDSEHVTLQEQCARALYNKGFRQGQLGETELAIQSYDELLGCYGDSEHVTLQEQCAKALGNKGFRQGELGESELAIQSYDELLGRYGESEHVTLQERCAQALYNKGFTQGELGESKLEIQSYDELLGRYGELEHVTLQEPCAKALYNKGVRQGELGESKLEIQSYDELLGRYGELEHVTLQEQCAKALYNKGVRQGELGESKLAIQSHDELLGRYGELEHVTLQEPCAQALVNKGVRQGELGESKLEIQSYDELLGRYGDSEHVTLQEPCAQALVHKGVTQGQLGMLELALKTYEEVLDRYQASESDAIKMQCTNAIANSVELLILIKNYPKAISRITQVLQAVDGADIQHAVMPFLRWLMDQEYALSEITKAIDELDASVEFTWGFSEIAPVIDQLVGVRKQQAKLFIDYFENHHERQRLMQELRTLVVAEEDTVA